MRDGPELPQGSIEEMQGRIEAIQAADLRSSCKSDTRRQHLRRRGNKAGGERTYVQRWWVRTDDLLDLLTVLEEDEGRHLSEIKTEPRAH